MIYMKHPVLGNRHFHEDQLTALLADGWVRWPRTLEQKNAAPQTNQGSVVSPPWSAPEPDGAAPEIDALKAKLDELGIKYHHRAGIKKLQEPLG